MAAIEPWDAMADAIDDASNAILGDRDPISDRERTDGQRYVARILRAVMETSLLDLDFTRPSFITMPDSVRHLGAAGPDIDYDVALVAPGAAYRITGSRGGAGYVGIVVYGGGGVGGETTILESIDVDTLVDDTGRFTYDVSHPEASRVIVRQYFHDRATEARGSWSIERTDDAGDPSPPASGQPDPGIVAHQLTNAAASLRWNAQLNQLWTPDRRDTPNDFVRQSADDIVAAIPNPDVTYSFTWWRLGPDEALEIDVLPPDTRYWSIQLCDRWFQSYPQRRSNLNDRQVSASPDGTVRIVLADRDPGEPNWLDTGGHHTGVVFFRWLHAEPAQLPTCRVATLS